MAKHLYKDTGLGTTNSQQPICVKYPPTIDAILRSLPNRSDFIRAAVVDKLKADGYI